MLGADALQQEIFQQPDIVAFLDVQGDRLKLFVEAVALQIKQRFLMFGALKGGKRQRYRLCFLEQGLAFMRGSCGLVD